MLPPDLAKDALSTNYELPSMWLSKGVPCPLLDLLGIWQGAMSGFLQ